MPMTFMAKVITSHLKITDDGKHADMMLNKNDTVTATSVDGEKYPIHASQFGGVLNNPYTK